MRHRDMTVKELTQDFAAAIGKTISRQTVYRRLAEKALYAQKPVVEPRSNVFEDFLEEEDICRMERPAKSLELNHIDYVWDALRRAISRRQYPPNKCQTLKSELIEEWRLLPQDEINNLICRLRTRCETCIEARGGHIS
ncbi:transposable element Tcb2 transposase [Trichonephila clavipes]|nr:transposable element Tcb2 transposase [Trichonephila clavipes]